MGTNPQRRSSRPNQIFSSLHHVITDEERTGHWEKRKSLLPSLTTEKNFWNMGITLNWNSPQKYHPPITKSSYMTLHSATKSPLANISSSPTTNDSVDSTQPLLCQMESKDVRMEQLPENAQKQRKRQNRTLQQIQCRDLQETRWRM